MNGQRMTTDQAKAIVGKTFAGHVNAGAGDGQWLIGSVIAVAEVPTITILTMDGQQSYVIDAIRDWAAGS